MSTVFDIVVDTQGDFMWKHGKLSVPGAEAIIPAVRAYITQVDSAGMLFTIDTHLVGVYGTSEEAKEFPIHCVKDTPGWELVVDPATVPVPVYTMEKGVFDMWHEPGLLVVPFNIGGGIDRETFFANLKASGITKLRIIGVAADYCVKLAVAGALAHGFAVEIIERLTTGVKRDMIQVVKEDFAGQTVTVV